MRYVPTKTTYLEMRHRPPGTAQGRAVLPDGVRVARLARPSVEAYRRLYDAVGSRYGWTDRNLMPDDELRAILQDDRVEVHVLHLGGGPAGYAELDCRDRRAIEIAYFGLLPQFVGRGLGSRFLQWVVDRAWSFDPQRVWLHTCDLDHPAALRLYGKAGFEVYDQRTVQQALREE